MQPLTNNFASIKFHLTDAFKTASDKHIPDDLIGIMSSYTADKYELAASRYELDADGRLIKNTHNQNTTNAIRCALSSAECPPYIKRQIFINANQPGTCRNQLTSIVADLSKNDHRINLDGVDLSGCNLSRLILTNISAIRSSFDGANIEFTTLRHSDLTGASFNGTYLGHASMRNTKLVKAKMEGAVLYQTRLDDADLTNAVLIDAIFCLTHTDRLITNDSCLEELIIKGKIVYNSPLLQGVILRAVDGVFTTSIGINPAKAGLVESARFNPHNL